MPRDALASAIDRVVTNQNCTGCGACAMVNERVDMVLDVDGYMRPFLVGEPKASRVETNAFNHYCPGVGLRAADTSGRQMHALLGPYVSVWEGHAADPEIRAAGSSAGALTAITDWLIATGRASRVAAAGADSPNPRRTVPVTIQTRQDALKSAGSRYAPVATLCNVDARVDAIVAKPCEISAVSRATTGRGERPVFLSFFCAGTPSQLATDRLVRILGADPESLGELRYRGRGWPGLFYARDRAGNEGSSSYEDSWGKHLGRDLQWRCKLCPDGTGWDADIAVGDFWETDERGFPLFEEAAGSCVIIARTVRGHELLMQARRDGALIARPVSPDGVARVQPLQVERRHALLGRLAGRLLAGKVIPKYRGYGLLKLSLGQPVTAFRGMAGTFRRTAPKLRTRKNGIR